MLTSQFFATALAAAPNEPSVGTVIATGLILVFSVLVLLYFIIVIQGKIFTAIDSKKSGPKGGSPVATAATQSKPAAPAPTVMHIEQGISGEIVAAISAAIACLDDGKYSIRSLTRTRAPKERSAWGNAGIRANTEPF